ncbi:MAG: hypothetical protein OEY11_15330 [Gammaproteobacteria bacterium]|nr:hypothetical protein [Gammaproteobacteria bacterium]
MVSLWAEIHDLYGDKAEMKLGLVGETKFNKWKQKIARLNLPAVQLRQLVDGVLLELMQSENIWPPELQEFMSRMVRVQEKLRGKVMYREFKSLPKPVIDKSENGFGKRKGLPELRRAAGLAE